MYARTAHWRFVISNLGPSGATALFVIFLRTVNAGGCNDRYFEFELTRPHCLANYFQDAIVNYAIPGRPLLPGSATVIICAF